MAEQSEEIKKGAQIAIWLHFLLIVGGLLYVFFDWILEDEPDPHVFKMVSIADIPSPSNQALESPENIQEPKVQKQEASVEQAPPSLEKVKHKTVPKQEVKKMEPAPVIPDNKVPKKEMIKQEIAPKPIPQKKMSYEDYLKQNPIKHKAITPPRESRAEPIAQQRIEAPTIKTSDMIQELNRLANQPSSNQNDRVANVSANEMQRYLSYVNRIIEMRWRGSMTSLPSGLKAVVSFRVEADGRISFVRLLQSSGDNTFDNTALTVLKKLNRVNRPPDGRAHLLNQPFESR